MSETQTQTEQQPTQTPEPEKIPYSRLEKEIEKRRELETRLSKFEADKKAEDDKKLQENNAFKELADKRQKEIDDLKARFDGTMKELTTEKKRFQLELHASKAGAIDSADIIRMSNLDAIGIDDTGNVTGVKEMIDALKKEKPYLFGKVNEPAPGVHTDKASGGKVWTRAELLKNTKAANEMYINDPAQYNRIVYGK